MVDVDEPVLDVFREPALVGVREPVTHVVFVD